MYAVSDAFLTAVKKNTRRYYWTGKITTAGGAVYEFTQNDIVKGSGYMVEFVTVRRYQGNGKKELTVTFRDGTEIQA